MNLAVCTGFSSEGAWHTHYASWGAASGLSAKINAFVLGAGNFVSGLGIPENVLTDLTSEKPCENINFFEASPHISSVEKIKEILLNSKNPIVLAGGGGWNEKGKIYLKKFVERENLPFVSLFRYQDIFDNYSHCYIGDAGVGMASYIEDTIKNGKIKITKLAQGLPVGGEIENLDDGTLISAFKNRSKINSD